MRKELIIAIILGSILGLIVAFGVWKTSSAMKKNAVDKNSQKQIDTSTPASFTPTDLTIVSPSDKSASISSEIEIQGITKPSSFVAVYGESKDYVTKSDTAGNFALEMDLVGGVNNLLVGNKKVAVVYSSEIPESEEKPSAILGIVTDKTENAIQLRDESGQIEQITITPDTTYARIGKTTNETDFDDLGIGDYVASIGSRSANIFTASRILATTSPELTKRKILHGTVTSTSAKEIIFDAEGAEAITIKSSDTPYVYEFDGNVTTRRKFGDVDEGDEIMALGLLNDKYLDTRTIFIISGNIN